MGIGFVLIIWIILLGIIGFPLAGILAYWSWRNNKFASSSRMKRAAIAGLFPYVVIPVGLIWFVLYAYYCGTIRNVDPGLGDSWHVPIQNSYYFCMTDNMDEGRIMKNSCSGSAPLFAIRELVHSGNLLVGANSQQGAFTFDMEKEELNLLPSMEVALSKIAPASKFQTAHEFYVSRRYRWQDIATLVPLICAVLLIARIWFNRYIRAPRNYSP